MRFRTFRGCFLIIFSKEEWMASQSTWKAHFQQKRRLVIRVLKLQNSRQPLKTDTPLSCWRGPLSRTLHLVRPAVDVGLLCGYDRDAGWCTQFKFYCPPEICTYKYCLQYIIISNWETTKAIPQIQVTCIINCCGMVELIATNLSSGVSAYNFYPPSKYQISFLSVLRCKSKRPPTVSSAHNPPTIIASLPN